MAQVGEYVFPGDNIDISKLFGLNESLDLYRYKHVLGPGIRFSNNYGLLISKFGVLKARYNENLSKNQNTSIYLWVESYGNTLYNIGKGDRVLGVVLKNMIQESSILVDTNSSYSNLSSLCWNKRVNPANGAAILPDLEFEGATKRNKPELKMGDLVYGQIQESHLGIDPVMTCKAGSVQNKCFDVDKYTFGIMLSSTKLLRFKSHYLKDESTDNTNQNANDVSSNTQIKKYNPLCHLTGFCWDTSIDHIIKLLKITSVSKDDSLDKNILKMIGQTYPFEIVVGVNGRIWIRAKNPEHTLKIFCIIQSLRYMVTSKCLAFWDPILNPKTPSSKQKQKSTAIKSIKRAEFPEAPEMEIIHETH